MTQVQKRALMALTLAMSATTGCSGSPTGTGPAPDQGGARPADPVVIRNSDQVKPASAELLNNPCPTCPPAAAPAAPAGAAVAAPIFNADCRFIAFSACIEGRRGHDAGSLFLWDEAIKDVFILNAALAGLNSQVSDLTDSQKEVEGPSSCTSLAVLNPTAFADGKVLFNWGHQVFIYDMVTEERVTVAFDGQSEGKGGPRGVITADGGMIAYVSNRGTVVLKETDGVYYTKTRELAKIAAEANARYNNGHHDSGIIYDIDISGDGRFLVVNIDGILYLYDVLNPHLFQLLPLSGSALAGRPDRIGHVAINLDGRFIAFTVNDNRADDQEGWRFNDDHRLLVLDRATGMIDTVPYPNLGVNLGRKEATILDPVFCDDGRSLIFEVKVGCNFKVWKYDIPSETMRAMVILNNVLGEAESDVLVSNPALDP
jgi:hypothetical protein